MADLNSRFLNACGRAVVTVYRRDRNISFRHFLKEIFKAAAELSQTQINFSLF